MESTFNSVLNNPNSVVKTFEPEVLNQSSPSFEPIVWSPSSKFISTEKWNANMAAQNVPDYKMNFSEEETKAIGLRQEKFWNNGESYYTAEQMEDSGYITIRPLKIRRVGERV